MTQRHIVTLAKGEPAKMIMGWDRPLQRFFASVTLVQAEPGQEPVTVYDSMFDKDLEPFGKHEASLEFFIDRLLNRGVYLPQAFIDTVDIDGAMNEGNVIGQYPDAFDQVQLATIGLARKACQDLGQDPDELVVDEATGGSQFRWYLKVIETQPDFAPDDSKAHSFC